jgi:hypothetical protein
MIHLFKVSDNSWIYSGSQRPANMQGNDYVEGVLPEGETWDYSYEYTHVDGVATKGSAIEIPEMPDNSYIENRIQAYPPMEEQLDNIFHNGVDAWKADIQAIKDAYPKP